LRCNRRVRIRVAVSFDFDRPAVTKFAAFNFFFLFYLNPISISISYEYSRLLGYDMEYTLHTIPDKITYWVENSRLTGWARKYLHSGCRCFFPSHHGRSRREFVWRRTNMCQSRGRWQGICALLFVPG
jgi:hypothetical protein